MDDDWRDRYLLSSRIDNPGRRAALYRAAARGRFVRVLRGVYLPVEEWQALDYEGRHRARMHAVELLRPGTVFSHLSAALLWGLPVVGGDLAVPHAATGLASGGRSMNGLRRHAVGLTREPHVVDGLRVTAPEETVLHLAASFEPEVSIPSLDAAFADPRFSLDRDELIATAAALPGSLGSARGTWALRFADGASGSPGESLSRVGFHRLRLPKPELQVRFTDAGGLIGVVDFWWRDVAVIGEFDGLGKYLRPGISVDTDPGEVVMAEKRREDRLRALGPRVARWGWSVARDLPALRRRLSEAGLRAP